MDMDSNRDLDVRVGGRPGGRARPHVGRGLHLTPCAGPGGSPVPSENHRFGLDVRVGGVQPPQDGHEDGHEVDHVDCHEAS